MRNLSAEMHSKTKATKHIVGIDSVLLTHIQLFVSESFL